MTEYRIIKRSIGPGKHWDDEYHLYYSYACFKNLGTQGKLFEKPKTSWRPLFYIEEDMSYLKVRQKGIWEYISEQLVKEGFSARDIITREYDDTYIFGSIDYKDIEPSEDYSYRDKNLEEMIKELVFKKV